MNGERGTETRNMKRETREAERGDGISDGRMVMAVDVRDGWRWVMAGVLVGVMMLGMGGVGRMAAGQEAGGQGTAGGG